MLTFKLNFFPVLIVAISNPKWLKSENLQSGLIMEHIPFLRSRQMR